VKQRVTRRLIRLHTMYNALKYHKRMKITTKFKFIGTGKNPETCVNFIMCSIVIGSTLKYHGDKDPTQSERALQMVLLICYWYPLTHSPLNKLSSATFLVCFHFQNASIMLKFDESIVWVSNSLYPDKTPTSVTRRLIRIQTVCIWHFGLCLAGLGYRNHYYCVTDVQLYCKRPKNQ